MLEQKEQYIIHIKAFIYLYLFKIFFKKLNLLFFSCFYLKVFHIFSEQSNIIQAMLIIFVNFTVILESLKLLQICKHMYGYKEKTL